MALLQPNFGLTFDCITVLLAFATQIKNCPVSEQSISFGGEGAMVPFENHRMQRHS